MIFSVLVEAITLSALPLAQAANFTVSLDRDTINLGESAALTMTFEGGNPKAQPTLPPISNLRVYEGGHSSQISIVNGQTSSTESVIFSLHPVTAGEFIIPALKAEIGGRIFTSQPLKLTVLKPVSPGPNADASNPQSQPAFLKLILPKKVVYVGEVIQLELQLYVRDEVVNIGNFQLSPLQAEGFTVGKMDEGPRRKTRINDLGYTVVSLTLPVIAAKAGKLDLGPAECSLDLLMGPFNFFGQPTRQQHVTLTSDPATVQSLPLPKENVPPTFNGAVGNFSMTASASPTNIAVGDPITVKIQISGRGAVDGVTLPEQGAWQQFKLYPPTSEFQPADKSGLNGVKNFALTIVPESMDIKELPPFAFSFFDPDQKSYRTLTQPAVPLTIRPSAASLPPPIVSNAPPTGNDNPPVQDIVHIKPRLGLATQIRPPLARQSWFLVLQGIPVLAWLALLIHRKQKERLANNPRLRRQRQVDQAIREGLKELRRSANANQPETFFATQFHLLQEQLGERLDLPASAITEAVVEERLRPLGLPEETLARMRELFQVCNQARYAPQSTNDEMMSLIPKVESALNELRKIKA